MSQIFVDEIAQSFVSNGNVFLKFSAITGDIDALGKDVKYSPVTLVIPLSRFQDISENITKAGEAYDSEQKAHVEMPQQVEPQITLGLPLICPN